MDLRILVINPGSTSTKVAYFKGEAEAFSEDISHPEETLASLKGVNGQLPYRLEAVERFVRENGILSLGLDAVAARGGLMKPVKSGVYRINEKMAEDLRNSKARWGREHASNLGAMIALELSKRYGVPAFTADPVTVDEMSDVARVSGVPEVQRVSHLHALNIKAMARQASRELGIGLDKANFVAAHMGGGTSVAAIEGGRIVDVNNALLGMGPFSPMRAGALPVGPLVELAFSGRYDKKALERKLVYDSGLKGYLGAASALEAERMIVEGDRKAGLIYSAMAYQVGKEIAAMAAALKGKVDAIILTGGVANSRMFIGMVSERVGFIARILVYPGQAEMESLATYAARALSGEEEVLEYD